ncbi:response regulator [Vampirovibrio chlorellavorus]|uniref:response regulator n=1 Tax=Vampirovibrio chlorellavorus TaxID=758823 RepID=UPI0026EA44CC|nr:response regulator [Vampirovibrio chlorellavorus]
MKVLSVDDSAIIRKIIRGSAETLGLDFLEAGDGQEALNLLDNEYPDVSLILLDWNMPVMDGFTTLQYLKADERFKSIPVMMVTTEAERANIVRAIQAGAKHYLVKPFSPEDLMTTMLECLGGSL